MFPIGDDNPRTISVPWVTWTLIAINVAVFILELQGGESFVREWAFIPAQFTENPAGEAVTLLSAMFMHGGWMHLIGNMLYLWIFGDNVEDRFGHIGFLIFYLLAGLLATFAQYAFFSGSPIPNVGASGAIAGVLGAYLLMFPQARVNVLVGPVLVALPAIVVLGLWIVLQVFSGVGSIAYTDETAEAAGGVAYMAHVGGFIAGLALTVFFRNAGNRTTTA